jgi:hypothetical protein
MSNVTDTFTRSAANSLGTADSGQTWSDFNGGRIGLSGSGTAINNIYSSDSGSVIDSGSPNATAQVTFVSSGGEGLIFNYTDQDNFWLLQIISAYAILRKRVAGVYVDRYLANVEAPGDVWSVTRNGDSIVVKKAGVTKWDITDSFGNSATKWGLLTRPSAEYDNFTVVNASGGVTPTKFAITQQPVGTSTGAVLPTQPVWQVQDASSALVTGDTRTATITLNTISGSGVLSGTTSKAAVGGVGTATDLKVTGTGTFTLTIDDGVLTPATTSQFTITARASSAYKNTATDGSDPGVNFAISSIHTEIARHGDRRGATRAEYAGTVDGAALPAFYCNLTEPVKTGSTHNVTNAASLTAAIAAAVPGDEIVVPAGVAARLTGNWVLPVLSGTPDAQPGGNGVVTIRSSALASLPYGRRVIGPNLAAEDGISVTDPAYFAHLRTNNASPVFSTAPGAKGWRLSGLYCDVDPAYTGVPNYFPRILYIGDGGGSQNTVALTPQNICIDRCIIRGHDDLHCRFGVSYHADYGYIIDSCIENIHSVNEGDCQAFVTWNSSGKLAVINTYLEASSECIVAGGANNWILEQTDVEFRWIRLGKPLKWYANDPSYIGFQWEIKNHLEVKHAHRLLIEGVYARHSWPQAQFGYSMLIKSEYANQVPNGTQDIVIRYVDISGCAIGIAVSGGSDPDPANAYTIKRVAIQHVLMDEVGGAFDPGGQFSEAFRFAGTEGVTVRHCTVPDSPNYWANLYTAGVTDGGSGANAGLSFIDNIFALSAAYKIKAAALTPGAVSMASNAPGGTVHGNVLVGDSAASWVGAAYSGNNFPATQAAVGFTDAASRDYRLYSTAAPVGGSPILMVTPLLRFAR